MHDDMDGNARKPWPQLVADGVVGRVARVEGLGQFWIPEDMEQDCILQVLGRGEEWDAEATPIMRKYVKEGDTVIDAGAFNGSRSVRLARLVGRRGRVYAWEPNPKIRNHLILNLALNRIKNVVVMPFAAGREPASADLWLAAYNDGGTSLVRSCDADKRGVTVPVLPLDAAMPDTRVTLIKIDVEGFEYELLQGAKQLLARDRPVLLIEIWDEETRRGKGLKTSQAKVFRLLTELGYQLPRMCDYSSHDYIAEPALS